MAAPRISRAFLERMSGFCDFLDAGSFSQLRLKGWESCWQEMAQFSGPGAARGADRSWTTAAISCPSPRAVETGCNGLAWILLLLLFRSCSSPSAAGRVVSTSGTCRPCRPPFHGLRHSDNSHHDRHKTKEQAQFCFPFTRLAGLGAAQARQRRLAHPVMLHRPHLMLPDTKGDERVAIGQATEERNCTLRREAPIVGHYWRIFFFQGRDGNNIDPLKSIFAEQIRRVRCQSAR